ncbi:MAG TPA: PIN domain-containing protein [Candidatus Nanoarchaeia archaeon]|nr:PIN domain-containing protein [Candidatus Nanoarchaeia archaeon]
MRLVVDTNRIIAAFIKDGISRHILYHFPAEFIMIPTLGKEVAKYRKEICQKAKLSEENFEKLWQTFQEKMTLLDDTTIESAMSEAKMIMDIIDKGDTPFLAAAIASTCDIWSDDPHLHKQQRVKAYTTKELLHYL